MTATNALAAAVGEGLLLDADLRLVVDGRQLHLSGRGRRLELEVERARDLAALRGSTPDGRAGADDLARVASRLDAIGVTLDVVDRHGTTLARVGRGAGSGLASRMVGGPVAVSPDLRRPALVLAAVVALAALVARSRIAAART